MSFSNIKLEALTSTSNFNFSFIYDLCTSWAWHSSAQACSILFIEIYIWKLFKLSSVFLTVFSLREKGKIQGELGLITWIIEQRFLFKKNFWSLSCETKENVLWLWINKQLIIPATKLTKLGLKFWSPWSNFLDFRMI